MRARVNIYPRGEILDPQGKAIQDALGRIGFGQVQRVRAGKSFEIDLAIDDPAVARQKLEEMCEKLLANPLIEEYSFKLLDAGRR